LSAALDTLIHTLAEEMSVGGSSSLRVPAARAFALVAIVTLPVGVRWPFAMQSDRLGSNIMSLAASPIAIAP